MMMMVITATVCLLRTLFYIFYITLYFYCILYGEINLHSCIFLCSEMKNNKQATNWASEEAVQ